LDELVILVADPERTTRVYIDLDAMPIVDDVQRTGPIIEHKARKLLPVNVASADIDRGLRLAG